MKTAICRFREEPVKNKRQRDTEKYDASCGTPAECTLRTMDNTWQLKEIFPELGKPPLVHYCFIPN